ncbi:MAG: thermonuclease family protein [Sedimentisphaerales bacterium]
MKNKQIRYAMSRRRKNALLLTAFLLAGAIIWTDRNFIHPRIFPQTIKVIVADDFDKYNQKDFTVVKVVDGDTLDIDIPDANYKTTRIRLWGVDTPETAKSPKGEIYYGQEASQFTKDTVLGKRIIVVLNENTKPRDKYGRLLAYIKLADGIILNEELISNGFAYADTRFKHPDYEKYIELESAARKEKKGLWKDVTPDQMPKWRQR